jgi:hypothetical protein
MFAKLTGMGLVTTANCDVDIKEATQGKSDESSSPFVFPLQAAAKNDSEGRWYLAVVVATPLRSACLGRR